MNITDFEIYEFEGMSCVKWTEIENKMSKEMYKDFCIFMNGQTCVEDAVFLCDLRNFLRPKSERFFD